MMLAVLLAIDVLLVLSFAFTPYVTRKTELFGVTIPAVESAIPELMRLRASYRNQMFIGGAVLMAVSVAIGLTLDWESPVAVIIWLVVLFAYLAAAFLLYLPKYRRMKEIKHEQGWDAIGVPAVILADTTAVTKDVVSPAWLLLFPLVIGLTVLGIVLIWPNVPDQIPMHFDVNGVADSFAPKGIQAVSVMIIIQVFLAVIIAGTYFMIRVSKRQIDAANPEVSRQQSIRFRRVITGFEVVVGVVTLSFIGVLQILMLSGVQDVWAIMGPVLALLVIIMVGTCFLMFRVGQGGSRLQEPKDSTCDNANVDDDKYWILGQFYFNRSDPAVFVEKRFGVGYTGNFARPLTWVLIAGLIVLIVAMIVVTTSLVG